MRADCDRIKDLHAFVQHGMEEAHIDETRVALTELARAYTVD